MSLFTPTTGIIGGSLIGASASTLLLLNGDIMGFSGLITTMRPDKVRTNLTRDVSAHWKLVWLSTFMLTVNFYVNHVQDATRDPRLETMEEVPIASLTAHILGGYSVGLGTKLANGCTSGHGVCGMARGSWRSWTAVPIFMTASMATAAIINGKRFETYTAFLRTTSLPVYSKFLGTVATAAVAGLGLLRTTPSSLTTESAQETTDQQHKVYGAAVSAVLAALGLIVSGMTKKSKVNDFLDLCALCRSGRSGNFDPTLLAVMGSAMATSWLGYQMVQGWNIINHTSTLDRPIVGNKFSIPTNTTIDPQLTGGAMLFGIGWGLTGLCPGPALYQAAAGMSDVVLVWFPSFFAGSWTGEQAKAYWARRTNEAKQKQT